MRDEGLLPQPVKRQKRINVPDETALNLENELELAKVKFQYAGGRRVNRTKTHDPGQNPRPELNESFKALSKKVKDYEAIKKGQLKSEVLAPDGEEDGSSSSPESESSAETNDTVEVEFEDGVVRKIPRSRFGENAPSRLIYGDVIQRGAFQLDHEKVHQLQEEKDYDSHYDADWEKRERGVGFFKFSKNNEERSKQMESLRVMREETMQKNAEAERKRSIDKQREAERWNQIASMRRRALEKLGTTEQDLGLAPLSYRTREDAWDEFLDSICRKRDEKHKN